MQYQPNLFRLLFIFIIFSAFLMSCGGSSSGTGEALLRGTIADVVAKEQVSTKSFFVAKLKELLTFSKSAVAQDGMVDLSGITVEAFDSENNLVGEGISDQNGNFEFTVPCNTPLTLVFMLDAASVEFGGIIVPCPEGEEEAVLFITVDLNFDEENGEIEFEVEEAIGNAQIGCNNEGNEPEFMEGEDLLIDGEGGACIITAGNCELEIKGGNVQLLNCSICIDTRGNSSVKIEASNFECESEGNGIRSVGNSSVEIKLVESEAGGEELNCTDEVDNDEDSFIDCDDEDCAEDVECNGELVENCSDEVDNDEDSFIDCDDEDCAESQACAEAECGSLSILAGEDGVDARGNASVKLDGDDDDSDDEENECSEVIIEGGENSIIAVGNAEVDVVGTSCTLFPEETVEKGNAEIEVECDGDGE